jgi:hypothetical protein
LSLKENIEMVKEELNSEEKFFENAVKAERFVKKYKNAIIGGISAVVVLVIANVLYEADKSATAEAANAAYATLLKNGDDALAQAELKKLNPDLYDIWSLSKAVASKDVKALESLSSSKAVAVADVASYEAAAIVKDAAKLDSYSYRQNAIYRELAVVENALLMLQKGDLQGAHGKLSTVSKESPLYKLAQMLMHYGVK